MNNAHWKPFHTIVQSDMKWGKKSSSRVTIVVSKPELGMKELQEFLGAQSLSNPWATVFVTRMPIATSP